MQNVKDRKQDRKSDGFAQRLLIRPPELRAAKKPLLAGKSILEYVTLT